MKLSVSKSAGFIAHPDKKLCLFLLYGPDSGLVRARGDVLAGHFVKDLSDPFAVAELGADTLAGDPARLADELATAPMLGGFRLVRVRDAGDGIFAAVETALEGALKGEAAAILEAGDLDRRSKLRLRIEDAENAMAIPCYPEEGAALGRSIEGMLKSEGFTANREALAALAGILPPDHIGVRLEIEKLMLYSMNAANKRIGPEDVEAALSDGSQQDVDEAVWAAASGNGLPLDKALARLSSEGVQPVQLLRAMQRHLLRLYEARSLMADGKGADEAMKSLRPPVFFKREAEMRKQIGLWTLPALHAAFHALTAAEVQAKSTGYPAELLAERAFLGLSRRSA